MTNNDLQEPLETFPPMLDNIVTEPICEDLARQWRDCHSCRFSLQDLAKVLEIRIAPTNRAMAELEGGDIGTADDLIVGVHTSAHAVGTRVLDFYLEEILRRAINLLEALLARIWHGLHLTIVGGAKPVLLACNLVAAKSLEWVRVDESEGS